MKQLSLWAYHHKWPARLLIGLSYLVLNIIAFLLGDFLLLEGIQVSGFLVYLFATAFLAAFVLYPLHRNRKQYRNYYHRQKTCDTLLITTTFLLLLSAANLRHTTNSPFQFPSAQAVVPVPAHQPETLAAEKPPKKRSFLRSVKTKLTNTLQKVRNYYRSLSNGERILLLVLLGFAAGLAFMGIAAWACNLSCAGSEGAALAVFLSGIGLITFLVVVAARAINRAYRKGKEQAAPPSEG